MNKPVLSSQLNTDLGNGFKDKVLNFSAMKEWISFFNCAGQFNRSTSANPYRETAFKKTFMPVKKTYLKMTELQHVINLFRLSMITKHVNQMRIRFENGKLLFS